MINEDMYALGAAPNKIREIFAYGLERKAQIGNDKVFDLSIGNPSVPSPAIVDETIARLVNEGEGTMHMYTMSPGLVEAREAIAQNLNRRYDTHYSAGNLYLAAGALGCHLHRHQGRRAPARSSSPSRRTSPSTRPGRAMPAR